MFNAGRVCYVWCNFEHGYMRRTTESFGALKDSSLRIIGLPLHNCLSYRNVLENGAKLGVLSKRSKDLKILEHTVWFKFCQQVVQIRIKKMYGETLDF